MKNCSFNWVLPPAWMWWRRSFKLLLDESDTVPAGPYGFTAEELDFIPSADSGQALNCDINHRLGRDTAEEE